MMKTRVFLLSSLCLAMVATPAMARNRGGAATVNSSEQKTDTQQQSVVTVQPSEQSILEDKAVENDTVEKSDQVFAAEIEVLKQEINAIDSKLQELQEHRDSSKGNHRLGYLILSLIFGIIGGMLAGYVKRHIKCLLNGNAMSPMLKQHVEQQSTTPLSMAQRSEQQSNIRTLQSYNQSTVNQQFHSKRTPNQAYEQKNSRIAAPTASQSAWSSERKSADTTVVSRQSENVSPIRETTPRPSIPKKRIAYANLSVPEKGMLIVADDELCDSNNGQQFKLEINEANGTATYTFTSDVLRTAIQNLSSYENFVDKFDFNQSATQVRVVSPGKLLHKDGYWLVNDLLKIEVI